jgi:hypothetical protein
MAIILTLVLVDDPPSLRVGDALRHATWAVRE